MFRKHLFATLLAWLAVAALAGRATAQSNLYQPKPLSTVGGPTGESLNQIYRSGVGQGYTASSLNLLSLQYGSNRTPYAGQSTTRSAAGSSVGLGIGPTGANKPFSAYTPSPTTSPYLNLFREDLSGNDDVNYNTLVRPQLQQQQFNEQVQRSAIDFNRQLQTLSARADFDVQGAKDQFPTGHQTVYSYTGHYYRMPHGQTHKQR